MDNVVDITKIINTKKALKPTKQQRIMNIAIQLLQRIDQDFHIVLKGETAQTLFDEDLSDSRIVLTSNIKEFKEISNLKTAYMDLNKIV